MEQKQNKRVKWDYDSCYAAAKQCISKTDFQKKYTSAYNKARINNWLKDYTWLKYKKLPNGYWTRDHCFEEAKKYKSRKEFNDNSGSAYNCALKNGWLDDYTWFEGFQKPANFWTRDRCFEEAKKYKSRKEFNDNSGSAYQKALQNHWLDDYTWFVNPNLKWTKETCFEEAKKYTTIKDFRLNGKSAYTVARDNNWLKDYTWLESTSVFWTRERCFVEAQKYKSRIEFQKNNRSAYTSARKNGWLDDYDWFEKLNSFWNKETCFKEAQKYNKRSDFAQKSSGAYHVARDNNWLDDYTWFEEFQKPKGYWTRDRCFEEAQKYNLKSEFKLNAKGAYNIAYMNGWIADYNWLDLKIIPKETKLQLLDDIDLQSMSDHQLLELISEGILPESFKKLAKSAPDSNERKDTIKSLKETILGETEETEANIESVLKKDADAAINEEYQSTDDYDTDDILNKDNLPDLFIKSVKIYDKFIPCYGERNEYLTKETINGFWNNIFKDPNFINKIYDLRKTASKWLSYVIDTFLNEYDLVLNEQTPEGWSQKFQPNLMQKLMAFRIAHNGFYGNWSGTGAGKTIAFLMATRRVDARVSVCVCPNSVIDTIQESIESTFPNSKVIIIKSRNDIITYDRSQYNYIIFNYEKFQQVYSSKIVQDLTELNQIDFICFDEVHKTKNNDSTRSKNLKNLRMLALQKNPNLKVLGMTATPIINNLLEVRTLLELITGTSFKKIIPSNHKRISNIHNAYKYLMLYGFRYNPNYEINMNLDIKTIDGTELIPDLLNVKNTKVNYIEGLCISKKFEVVAKKIKRHRTIIYTQFLKELLPKIKKELKSRGFTYMEYTGNVEPEERRSIINRFANKKFDVILASSPISTGVDGLQRYCDNIIIFSLPWTNAEYTQLIGRINRQGSVFKSVNVIIPQVIINMGNGKKWSWDESRWKIIMSKKTLSDAVVDGIFTDIYTLDRSKLLRKALENLRNGIEEVNYERPLLMVDLSVNDSETEYGSSVMNSIHQKANTSNSQHMHEYFTENPGKWQEYHAIREERKKKWSIDPLDVIAEKLNNEQRNSVIADIGCGTNMLKTKVKSYKTWYSVDHYSDDPTVIKADAADLKEHILDNSVDYAVFCLSLWGRNYIDSIKEAYRYLKPGGKMFIVKTEDKVNQNKLISEVIGIGFSLIDMQTDSVKNPDADPLCTYLYYTKN